jgi:hypothetical protein
MIANFINNCAFDNERFADSLVIILTYNEKETSKNIPNAFFFLASIFFLFLIIGWCPARWNVPNCKALKGEYNYLSSRRKDKQHLV